MANRGRRGAGLLGLAGTELPEGSLDDPPDALSVCGRRTGRTSRFFELLAGSGVEEYKSTLGLIGKLHDAGEGVALITSIRNADSVLNSADVDRSLFDAIVDGNESARQPSRQTRPGHLPRDGWAVGCRAG
jgi:hypothetical protein